MTDIARDLAYILRPNPPQSDEEDWKEYQFRLQQTKQARDDLEARFRSIQLEQDGDPVLARLQELEQQRRQAVEETRAILAYAREFVRPEPYRLQALAKAAGMSISGVRSTYDHKHIEVVANRLQRSDRRQKALGINPPSLDLLSGPIATIYNDSAGYGQQ
ncbi:hypothetical protein IL992_34850 [Microbispora sp. NEAU-D428]|uniref:hypothetical protein n=1 Tax=Microbispora sitophila TaxID=2771537 RepID=UPI0018676D37|nr:hypothetical protein [Microbispora sitophila]MBE3014317.1 hypothetical protein [Microbispora sitophila]